MSLQRVTRSTIIDAPVERVWEVLRDFNSHLYWHPIIASSAIEDGLAPDQVGCVRNFKLQDGALREQLLTLDDHNFVSTYCILDSTIPLQRYVATVRLKPVTDGRRTLGAVVIGTVGSETKARIAREYCDHVVVSGDGRFADAVLGASAGNGVNLIIDGLGEAAREENMKALAMTGHWISVGQATGAWQPIDPGWLGQKSVTFSRPVIFHYTGQPRRLREMAARVFDALRTGTLRPQTTRYALSAAATAHHALETRRTVGQVVLLA